jgi:ectoine hydroxylase-related dioxygenase (phytanoyl-CoA dioxygenase family)
MSVVYTQLTQVGYAVVPGVVEPEDVETLARRADDISNGSPGTRRLLDAAWCSELAERLMVHERLREVGLDGAHPVQCTLFTKSAESNWLVALHQDVSVPVAERVSDARFSGWSEKEDEIFVQGPVGVLQLLLAVRVHLDDCDERNGALRVVPGSHQLGRLKTGGVTAAREALGELVVPVPRGGAMVMRPLLLHASSKSVISGPRRVLHFVFGPRNLPTPLRWPHRKRSLVKVG